MERFSLSERITWIGTILGLIVNIITILKIVGVLMPSDTVSFLNPSPILAIFIWLLALFTYFALLHSYWEKHLDEYGFHHFFIAFVFDDLLLKFKKPFQLLPLVLLIAIAFPLSALGNIGLTAILVAICVLAIIVIISAKFASAMVAFDEGPSEPLEKKLKKIGTFGSIESKLN